MAASLRRRHEAVSSTATELADSVAAALATLDRLMAALNRRNQPALIQARSSFAA